MNGPLRLPVPAYLGQVVGPDGAAVGTCFQVAPGVLVTAAHVLAGVGAEAIGDEVGVEPLGGGHRRPARIAAFDALSDLAVLTTAEPLDASIAGLAATDGVAPGTEILVTGVAELDDPGHTYAYLEAIGTWTGSTLRDGAVLLGRLESQAVMAGMSGAPVRRDHDDVVVGVVSARYNAGPDGWGRDSAWVARTERLEAMCAPLAPVTVAEPAPTGRLDLVLAVDDAQVRLTGPGIDVADTHGGVSPGLANAVDDVRRRRAGAGTARHEPAAEGGGATLGLGRAGQLLGASFLPAPVADGLAGALARARAANRGLRVGVEVSGPLARLPWEALPTPGAGLPLALHPLVEVYRRSAGAEVRNVPGPLRILVAIASPEGGGAVLDYERELRNVVEAVRAARAGAAVVREVRFATTAAIAATLEAEDFHVLHLSAHGSPGTLVIEHEDGRPRGIGADEFVDEAVPPGRMPPLICLAACHTNVANAADAPSFAAGLLARGAAAVVATETSVTDRYATRLFAHLYGRLAGAARPDVVAALCEARRGVQAELDATTAGPDAQLAALDEWAVVTVAAPSGRIPLFDPATQAPVAATPESPRIGVVAGRRVGDFVGRRAEQRHWPARLLEGSLAGLVLHGIGGVGKTTLASELVALAQAHEPDRLLAQVTGEVSVEEVLGAVAAAVRRHLLMAGGTAGLAAKAVEMAGHQDVPWADRFALLRQHVLGAVPVLMVLDNFEDNLAQPGPGPPADDDLATLLAAWATDPGPSRLLITCRYRFTLPGEAETALAFEALGPLTLAETTKLVWSLPALDLLSPEEVEAVWRMVGGHPRSLEYLDALLSAGKGRYPDITARLRKSLDARMGPQAARDYLASPQGLDAAMAEVAVLAADDVLLDDLLGTLDPEAEALLLGLAVYREPIDDAAVAFAVGEPDDAAGYVPDRKGANERVEAILAEAGIDTSGPVDASTLPPQVLAALTPHLAEAGRLPTPPRRLPAGVEQAIGACAATTLLGVETDGGVHRSFFVHRWSASELDRRWAADRRAGELAQAHRRAAAYWQWRVEVWPQGRAADVHDQLEARHHLLAAGEVTEAAAVTEAACSVLHALGAWDREAALVLDTLRRLPEGSGRRPALIGQLGILAQDRGDYAEAEARYRQSLEIDERLGNLAGATARYHQLGTLAQLRSDYEEAEARYRQSLEINERLGNQASMAASYHQLGTLAQLRGDDPEAEDRFRQSLEINERLGNLAGATASYHQLGVLAQERGDYDEAEARYHQSLEISRRLGNQADMAASYHQLGRLAELRDKHAEAESRYRQSLEINERLGNQADMSASYHQLGMLAQLLGDHDEAEARYRQSFEIDQRLGNRAGMASSISQMGVLITAQGRPADAVSWHVRALAIRLQLGAPQARVDVWVLTRLRDELGAEQFLAVIEDLLDDASRTNLLGLLDSAQDEGRGEADG